MTHLAALVWHTPGCGNPGQLDADGDGLGYLCQDDPGLPLMGWYIYWYKEKDNRKTYVNFLHIIFTHRLR